MAKSKQVTSWSYSRYADYRQCPFKFKLKHIDKISEPPNKAMERGSEIHNKVESYLKGSIVRLPTELKLFQTELKKLKGLYKKKVNSMVVEDTWAFTKEWNQTQWNDWAGCWVRIKLDCAHYEDDETLIITDWKTGKFREELHQDYLEQLELYALSALLLYNHVNLVKPRLVYLDQGKVYPENSDDLVFTRSNISKLKKTWEKRVRPMMVDKIFAPRANDKCKWCFYRKSNIAAGGGQCKF